MQGYTERMLDNALPVSAALAAAGAVAGYLGTVIPTTFLFMLSGLMLMMHSGQRNGAIEETAAD